MNACSLKAMPESTLILYQKASLDDFVKYAASIAPIGNVVNAAGVDSGSSEMIWKINVQGTINVVEAFLQISKKDRRLSDLSFLGK